MKSLINLAAALLTDVGSNCSVETARDLITIKSRAQHEGISFLTITLPEFSSDFERALEKGQVDSTLFTGWRKRGCLPAFMRGFTSLVFETDGRLKHEPNEEAVYSIRQVCRFFKKVRIDCTRRRNQAAFKKYLQTESDLQEIVADNDRTLHFSRVCDIIWSDVLGTTEDFYGSLVPRHGPGATCERISGNAKYAHQVWYERLDRSFPVVDYLLTSVSQIYDENHGLDRVTMVPEDKELPVRVISVPKTLKAPRIIAIEPVCMQYTQQALSRWIIKKIQNSKTVNGAIRFTDQTENQRQAMNASLTGQCATIDLSDASDRVSLSGVRIMLQAVPELLRLTEACRSRNAKLPDGTIVPLRKFASMGSALCFPIESMYFYSVVIHSILWKHRLEPRLPDIRKISGGVHIFGDDIIVPKGETDTVLEALASYGCKVNTTKSFWKGNFRESCGVDAFHGVDVTPIYLRELRPSNRRASSGLVSWVATSNLLHKIGCWHAADFMKREVERVLGLLPVLGDDSPGLGWYSFLRPPSKVMCRYTHNPITKTYVVRPRYEKDTLDGYPALLKYFLRSEGKPFDSPSQVSKKHLTQSVRCGTVSRQRHWVPVY